MNQTCKSVTIKWQGQKLLSITLNFVTPEIWPLILAIRKNSDPVILQSFAFQEGDLSRGVLPAATELICMTKRLNTLSAVKVRKIRENYHLKRKIVICPRLM